MKTAIVTRADENVKSITDLTFPLIKNYASKTNSKFIILSHEPPVMSGDKRPHYRITEVRNILNDFDRVLNLDCDMLINPNCPNIFDIVPEDMIGSIYEDKGSRAADRKSRILNIQKHWGDVNWSTGYTNAGTFLVSKMHKDIFLPHNGEYWLEWGSADLHLSYNIHKLGFKIFELEYKWNHMTMFSEPWNNFANRFEANIIHYAGVGVFDCFHPNRVSQIKSDISIFAKKNQKK